MLKDFKLESNESTLIRLANFTTVVVLLWEEDKGSQVRCGKEHVFTFLAIVKVYSAVLSRKAGVYFVINESQS